ncbi:hypothetical protein M3Y99_01542900 [Aphelenchoides fujianensis]|nr:hypothetical protein M3Y99_01542900 [Aphelenchoides fujianensis]
MGILRPSLDRMQMSKAAEFQTLIIYLRDIGLKELGMREIDLAAIANRSYYNWLFFSGLSATLRNGGHFARVVHISDCGYLPLSLSECHEYLEQHGVKNADIAAKHYFSMLERSLEIAQSFHNSHLDKVEFSTLCHLSVLRKGS